MMAMFGWTDPKMPAHYIAQANQEKLGMSGMDKIVGSKPESGRFSAPCPTRTESQRMARTDE
jgi:hypothetical protein